MNSNQFQGNAMHMSRTLQGYSHRNFSGPPIVPTEYDRCSEKQLFNGNEGKSFRRKDSSHSAVVSGSSRRLPNTASSRRKSCEIIAQYQDRLNKSDRDDVKGPLFVPTSEERLIKSNGMQSFRRKDSTQSACVSSNSNVIANRPGYSRRRSCDVPATKMQMPPVKEIETHDAPTQSAPPMPVIELQPPRSQSSFKRPDSGAPVRPSFHKRHTFADLETESKQPKNRPYQRTNTFDLSIVHQEEANRRNSTQANFNSQPNAAQFRTRQKYVDNMSSRVIPDQTPTSNSKTHQRKPSQNPKQLVHLLDTSETRNFIGVNIENSPIRKGRNEGSTPSTSSSSYDHMVEGKHLGKVVADGGGNKTKGNRSRNGHENILLQSSDSESEISGVTDNPLTFFGANNTRSMSPELELQKRNNPDTKKDGLLVEETDSEKQAAEAMAVNDVTKASSSRSLKSSARVISQALFGSRAKKKSTSSGTVPNKKNASLAKGSSDKNDDSQLDTIYFSPEATAELFGPKSANKHMRPNNSDKTHMGCCPSVQNIKRGADIDQSNRDRIGVEPMYEKRSGRAEQRNINIRQSIQTDVGYTSPREYIEEEKWANGMVCDNIAFDANPVRGDYYKSGKAVDPGVEQNYRPANKSYDFKPSNGLRPSVQHARGGLYTNEDPRPALNQRYNSMREGRNENKPFMRRCNTTPAA